MYTKEKNTTNMYVNLYGDNNNEHFRRESWLIVKRLLS